METPHVRKILLGSGFILPISPGHHGLFLTLGQVRSWTRATQITFLRAIKFWNKAMPGNVSDEEIVLIVRSFVQNFWYKEVMEIPPTVEKNHERRVKKFLRVIKQGPYPRKGKKRHTLNPDAFNKILKMKEGTVKKRILDIFSKIQPATAREVFENQELSGLESIKKSSVNLIMSSLKKERIIIPE